MWAGSEVSAVPASTSARACARAFLSYQCKQSSMNEGCETHTNLCGLKIYNTKRNNWACSQLEASCQQVYRRVCGGKAVWADLLLQCREWPLGNKGREAERRRIQVLQYIQGKDTYCCFSHKSTLNDSIHIEYVVHSMRSSVLESYKYPVST